MFDEAWPLPPAVTEMDPEALHASLNDEQRAAVMAVDGPVMVVAGAGTGKTKTLTHRAAELLRRGVHASNILVVTFTNDAAGEIRNRLLDMCGSEGEHIVAGTFHSTIFSQILKGYPESKTLKTLGINMEDGPDGDRCAILSQNDSSKYLRQAFSELSEDDQIQIEHNDWSQKRFEKELTIARAKGLDVLDYSATIRQGQDDALFKRILARAWGRYTDICREHNGIDFDDILVVAAKMLRQEPHIARELGERFQYIMLDEYQDTNRVQMNIMDAIAEGHGNIFMVGDEKQGIYGFRGADTHIFLTVRQRHPGVRLFELPRNYRSGAGIIRHSNALAKAMPQKLSDGQLLAESKAAAREPSVVDFADAEAEARVVVEGIRKRIAAGAQGAEIAVLYRNRSLKMQLEREMIRQNIPFMVVGDKSFYERAEVRDAIALLRFIFKNRAQEDGYRVLKCTRMGLSDERAKKQYMDRNIDVARLLDQMAEERLTQGKKVDGAYPLKDSATKIAPFVGLREALRECVHYGDDPAFVREVLGALWDRYLRPKLALAASRSKEPNADAVFEAQVANVATVFERFEQGLKNGQTVADIFDNFTLMEQDSNESERERMARVRLMTIHASKGLEFPTVFIIGLDSKAMPGTEQEALIDEERRILYVAMTRAQNELIMTYSNSRLEFGQRAQVGASPFLEEIESVTRVPRRYYPHHRDPGNNGGGNHGRGLTN
ncbi:DNA helicase-2/ATP-dependent DNA helicase PcrA [Natronocella acetinitrilica]|uniref:DNA 3'-5' helicase n=1 Tax=Natronocella acetinitrilica TaxID=414046 RepID=A0AAE3G1R8_9GAMM|nr:ATP-dependent helicase [Natronocella acetinitrilica]MCP1674230.1 DNA helicase-2/ATP-dependent DNA helicase PcrA [Natronocella acetinitrilica]